MSPNAIKRAKQRAIRKNKYFCKTESTNKAIITKKKTEPKIGGRSVKEYEAVMGK